MNTSMKIYLVMHKFCNEDYDGNTMLGEEIIHLFLQRRPQSGSS